MDRIPARYMTLLAHLVASLVLKSSVTKAATFIEFSILERDQYAKMV